MPSRTSYSSGYRPTTTDSNQSRAHPCTEQNFTLRAQPLRNLYSLQSLYFCSILLLLAIGGIMFCKGRDLERRIRNADQRRQERQREDFHDEC